MVFIYIFISGYFRQEPLNYTRFMNEFFPKRIPQPLTSFTPALRPRDLETYVFGRLKWDDVPSGIAPYVEIMFQVGRLSQVLAKIARRR